MDTETYSSGAVRLRGQGTAAAWTAQSPSPCLVTPTWIQGGCSLWQQAEVHLAEVNSVVERRKEHPPNSHDSSHQHVDGVEEKSSYAEHAPGDREEKG